SSPAAELDPQLARRLATDESSVRPIEPEADSVPAAAATPSSLEAFACLAAAADEDIAAVLEAETPQTAALVVSHLRPARAAEVLARVAPPRQAEIVRRLVELEQTDSEVIRLVERGVEERLQQIAHERRR